MVFVDSSVWIEALRREGRIEVKLAMEALLEADAVVICSPVRLEVLGAASSHERRRINTYLSEVMHRSCHPSDWEQALALSWRLRDRGVIVAWTDVLIASMALHDGEPIYSIDNHFELIARETGLNLYQPGYGGAYRR